MELLAKVRLRMKVRFAHDARLDTYEKNRGNTGVFKDALNIQCADILKNKDSILGHRSHSVGVRLAAGLQHKTDV